MEGFEWEVEAACLTHKKQLHACSIYSVHEFQINIAFHNKI